MSDSAVQDVDRTAARSVARGLRTWLSSGELQSSDGAICAWRDSDTEGLAFEYPEITGYWLTWLSGLGALASSEAEMGRRAADWLVGRLAARDRSARAGWDGGAVYTFDLGMVSAGLQTFGERVEDEAYVTAGRELARTIAAYVHSPSGLEAIAPDGPPTTRPGTWSTSGKAHLVKCVQALLLADLQEPAGRLVARTVKLQQADGRFPTQPAGSAGDCVMLHPHLYTAEGLWMWGMATGDRDALDHARKAAEWVWEHQLSTGGLPRFAGGSSLGPEQLDVTSQAVRVSRLLGVGRDSVDMAVDRLCEVAIPGSTSGCAMVYQPYGDATHRNSWVSMFGAQALSVASEGAQSLEWKAFV